MLFSKKGFSSAEDIEKDRALKNKLYQEFVETHNSKEVKEYAELDKVVNSAEFQAEKQRLTTMKFKGSDAYYKEKEFGRIRKSAGIKAYNRLKDTAQLMSYEAFKASKAYANINDAEARKNDSELKDFYKFEHSKLYRLYAEVVNSSILDDYKELDSYLSSDEFIDFKDLCADKQRYKRTDAYAKEKRFLELKSKANIAHYVEYKDTDFFYEQENWELSFSEEFDSGKIDRNKWADSYKWTVGKGDNLYATLDEHQAFNSDKNIDISSSKAIIRTRKRKSEGKFWDPVKGFCSKEVPFGSAMINTGNSHEIKEGKVELKVRVTGNANINHNVWMANPVNDQILLLFKAKRDKYTVGTAFKQNGIFKQAVTNAQGINLRSGWSICSIEWDEKRIIWKVNNREVHTIRFNLKKDIYHLIISSTVTEIEKAGNGNMHIDWVRTYSRIKKEE